MAARKKAAAKAATKTLEDRAKEGQEAVEAWCRRNVKAFSDDLNKLMDKHRVVIRTNGKTWGASPLLPGQEVPAWVRLEIPSEG